jgi:ABC-2 type transport system permease protein
MVRYLRLYGYFLRFSFSKAFEFRVDYYFRVVMDLIYYTVNITFYKVLFEHTSLLGGWNERQMMVFIGTYLVVDALHMSFFSNNMWWLPISVNRGDLDYYLVRPVSTLFFVSLREFAANSALNLAMALAVLGWAVSGLKTAPRPLDLVVFAMLVLNGCLLVYVVHVLALLPVFWTHSARGLANVFFMLSRFMERPDRIFTGVVRAVLITVLPFSLMTSFPARVILEGLHGPVLLQVSAVTVVLFAAMVGLWRLALRSYSSASS